VDSNLEKAALKRNEISDSQFKGVLYRESNLEKIVNAVITCSENDKKRFEQLNAGKLVVEVVPNGITIPERRFDAGVQQDQPEYLLFCGSLWSLPNAEGLYWFCKNIWPIILHELPTLKLLIIGAGDLPEKYLDIKETQNIEFTGAVEDVKTWYNCATIAVVPLLTGSGTRLKILEAMALGVPVISTQVGAEGINYNNETDIIIANEEKEFAEKVITLLKNKKLRIEIAERASGLVKNHYDWNIIGNHMKKVLTLLTNKEQFANI
jgi:glycosyltransferase involved in cell wall biosynthesis